ncbi:hypothetical protein GUJ93_ZPchr0013g37194 [Zizania palustris]|uniref:R13L1/DRL21-like LRR repeat region domain-containing protein n=1 Tax=Zizania palustris TaxID=103762 RepID=A0A8J5X421_ZIZPA|nr:hypothetical protein GUJ93_ZPchr0013g37194 [Zizania palustris]
MNLGDEYAGMILSTRISKVVEKLRLYLGTSSDSFKSTTKKLDVLEDKLRFLHPDNLQLVKPDKEEAAAAWLRRVEKATHDAVGLLEDMESEVKAHNSSDSSVVTWLSSDNGNMIRMIYIISKLSSVYSEGESIFDTPRLNGSSSEDKISLSNVAMTSQNKSLLHDDFLIGRDEEIAMLRDMVLDNAHYVAEPTSLEFRKEDDQSHISQKGWITETLQKIDLSKRAEQATEVSPYLKNEMGNKVGYNSTVTYLRNPTVIPIVGVSGVGKSALAQFIFNDRNVQQYFGPIFLDPLQTDDSWTLFKSLAFVEPCRSLSTESLEEIGRKITQSLGIVIPHDMRTLKHLRYLDLSFTGIKRVPDSVCSLCHLQVLGLRGCTLHKLPGNMNSLINLRHLHASSDTIAKINGIGKLTKLQELRGYHVKAEDGHRITELSDLNDLRGSLCILKLEMVTNPSEALEANIVGKKDLTTLDLRWSAYYSGKENTPPDLTMAILECLSPPTYLQDLKLYGYSGFAFPEWLSQLKHGKTVEISSCKNLTVLPPLGQLENLQKLKLYKLPSIKHIGSEFYGTSNVVFQSLEELSFEDMESWESWMYAGSNDFIPNLQKLRISSCGKLSKVPFESLRSSMKDLLLRYSGSYGDTVSRNLKDLQISYCGTTVTELDEELQMKRSMPLTQINRVMHSLTHLTFDGIGHTNVIPQTPSLRYLHLDRVRKLTSTFEQWIQQLTSLQELEFSMCDVLPSSLNFLSSLKKFTLKDCAQIHSIPPNSLPGNLKELQIEGWCSFELLARCQNPNGEAWHGQPQKLNMDTWTWVETKEGQKGIDRGQPKIFQMQRTEEKQERLVMDKKEEPLKSAKVESLYHSDEHQWHGQRLKAADECQHSFSKEDNPSNVDGQLEEEKPLDMWLQLSHRPQILGKDWPNISHIPYIRVKRQIVQNLYT